MSHHLKDRRPLQIVLLVLVSAVIFGNTIGNDFIWDDLSFITENQHIRDYRNILLFFTPHYWNELHPFPTGNYRPVRELSYAVDYFFWKLNPAGYHLTNLFLHTINVILIFYLVTVIADGNADRQKEKNSDQRLLEGTAFLTALLFAAHPIHTESINFIKNRSDLLAFLFFLISFLLFIKHLAVTDRMFRRLLLLSSWFCFIPAVLSKEIALFLPGMVALYAACFLSGPKRKKALIYTSPYGVIVIVYFCFIHSFINPMAPSAAAVDLSAGRHLLTVIKTTGFYFKMLAAPVRLNADHAFPIPESMLEPAVILPLMALLLAGIVAAWSAGRARVVFFSISWIVLTLLPVSNIIYLWERPIAEQRLYIPSFGFCLLLGYGLHHLSLVKAKRITPARAVIISWIITGVVISAYAVITVRRNFDWRDEITLYSRALIFNPTSVRMHNNLGVALNKAVRYEEAISHYRTALRLSPDSAEAYYNFGITLDNLGRHEEAIENYRTALRLKPDHVDACYNLGVTLYDMGRYEEAIDHYQAALRLKPDYTDVHYNLGIAFYKVEKYEEAIKQYRTALSLEPDNVNIHYNLGIAFYEAEKYEEAAKHYRAVLNRDKNNIEALNNLGAALHDMGRLQEACDVFQEALRADPDNIRANRNLGDVLVDMGRFEEAIEHFSTVLRLQPDYPALNCKIGNLFLKNGEPEKAVPYYLKALAEDPDNMSVWNNMGLALMKQGRIDEAVPLFRKVLESAPDNIDARCNLGVALMTGHNYQEALALFSGVLEMNPDHEQAGREREFCLKMMGINSALPSGNFEP